MALHGYTWATSFSTTQLTQLSGYLHIGHAKAAILNDYFAHEAHQGKLIVRFDDTNPVTESREFEKSILSDLELLGIHADRVTYTSDYFNQLQTYAEKMILDGNAYADDTPSADLADQRAERLPSRWRDRPVEENLAIFQEMVSGSAKGRRYCLRARLNYDSLNGALRDPIIYRFPNFDKVANKERPHHRTGWRWKIYPTYDFACPVVDSLEGVTHALRTTEYTDRNEQYQWFLGALRLRQVHIWDFARINFVHTFLSKRKLKQVIETGHVSGWDDPRMPTVRGIIRRGLTIPALRQFMLKQGPSRNAVSMDWTILWALNQKVIDPIATRLTAVNTERMIAAHISNGPAQMYFESKSRHPKQPALGTRPVAFSSTILLDQADGMTFALGEEITLMKWGNAIVTQIDKDGDIITGLELRLHLEGDFRKTEKKVTWLAAAEGENKLARAQLWTFDHLLTKDSLNKDDKLQDHLNKKSANMSEVLCDADLTRLKEGDVVQMERKGFFRLDKTAAKGTDWKVILFKIPSASKTRSDATSRSSVV